jgi:DNA-binding NtrC family response regulator
MSCEQKRCKPIKLGSQACYPSQRNSKSRVLVVDDDASVRTTVAMLLEFAGYEVSTAENGFEAVLKLFNTHPALVISDLYMPRMSGFELLSVVHHRFPDLLTVAMSGAYGSCGDIPAEVIADGFYIKGQQHPEALLRIVACVFQTAEQRRILHRSTEAVTQIADALLCVG